jgi:hypothetical protein
MSFFDSEDTRSITEEISRNRIEESININNREKEIDRLGLDVSNPKRLDTFLCKIQIDYSYNTYKTYIYY